jgi:inhibitor of KinA sporulation pathway (predicted exonuclease)
MGNAAFVCLDTETTGLEAGSRLIELAAVTVDEAGVVCDVFDELVHPGMPIPGDVVAVHGIDDATLAGSLPAQQVLQNFFDWLPEGIFFVAHNAGFDANVIALECSRAGLAFPAQKWIDSRSLASQLGETPDNRLQTLVRHHGWQCEGPAHRALPDAHAVRFLLARARSASLAERLFSGRKLLPKWAWPDTMPEHLAPLPAAIAAGQTCRMAYLNRDGVPSEQVFTPYGLALRKEAVVFHGWSHWAAARRSYRASGVRSFQVEAPDD